MGARRRPSWGARLAGWVGELLVTAGVVVGLFVVWQLWWTSVDAGHEADAAVAQFYDEVPRADPRPRPDSALHTDHVPKVATVGAGQSMGVLIVPAWQGETRNRMPIAEGTTLDVLDRAFAGHYTGTATPGQVGNFALAGHRRTYGNSFRYVDQLEKGDALVVETPDYWFVYRVTSHQIVLPSQVDVIAPVPGDPGATPTRRLITLTTCHSLRWGAFGNDHRWIVHGELEGWLRRSEGTPQVVADMKADASAATSSGGR